MFGREYIGGLGINIEGNQGKTIIWENIILVDRESTATSQGFLSSNFCAIW